MVQDILGSVKSGYKPARKPVGPTVEGLPSPRNNVVYCGPGKPDPNGLLRDAFRCGSSEREILEGVRKAVAAGANLNPKSFCGKHPPLVKAIFWCTAWLVGELLNLGADPNGTEGKLEFSPLMHAARDRYTEKMETLLARGVNPNFQLYDGSTAMSEAAFYGQLDAVRALVLAGANPEIGQSKGLSTRELLKKQGLSSEEIEQLLTP